MKELVFKVGKVRTKDINAVLDIALESDLSFWSRKDYEDERGRDDSIFLIAENGDIKLGFILARLITINSNNAFKDKTGEYRNLSEQSANTDTKLEITGKIEVNTEIDIKLEVEIYNIAVAKYCRGRGIGAILLNTLIKNLPAEEKTSIWLEVRESNRQAIEFYKKQGFEESYRRKNYYAQPFEDAMIMKKEVMNRRTSTDCFGK